ncbi:MAG: nucleotide sugar dehydrogenase [Phycisphaerales bacterium]
MHVMALPDRITDRSAVVCVVGMGYVGLPLARAFVDGGLRVLGFDVDPAKVQALNAGRTYLHHLGEGFVRQMRASGRFEATGDETRLADADAILICVPTPLDAKNEPDLSYVEKTADAIARHLRPGQLVVLESTTYPGTTREVVLPRLERARADGTRLACGSEAGFYLAFSPEREDPGRKDHTVSTIPKLVGGIDAASTRVAAALYRVAVQCVIEVSSSEVAESAKLVENIYRAVNIAMVNELKVIFEAMGIDVWEVIEAAKTKPFGFAPFYPGPGLGGHCIPIDPFYLAWRAKQVGERTGRADVEARFIELAGRVNHAMPEYVVARTAAAVHEFQHGATRSSTERAAGAEAMVPAPPSSLRDPPWPSVLNSGAGVLRGKRILILGLAYKPDIDDVRESPSFELVELFRAAGCHVEYHDPHVPRTHAMRRYGDLRMESVLWSAATLAAFDAVVIATHHAWYDWAFVGEHAKLVVDTRGVMRGVGKTKARVVGA